MDLSYCMKVKPINSNFIENIKLMVYEKKVKEYYTKKSFLLLVYIHKTLNW